MPDYDHEQNYQPVLEAVEQRFGRARANTWRNKDFIALSIAIQQKTKTAISPATLKRLYGKVQTPKGYRPQEATLRALIEYSDYQEKETSKAEPSQTKFAKRKHHLLILLISLLLISLLFTILYWPRSKQETTSTASLKLLHIDGNSPATVRFAYEARHCQDSLFIDFGDGFTPEYIHNSQGVITHYYRYPGFFEVRLLCRGKAIGECLHFILPTEGWQALASYFNQSYHERFYPLTLPDNFSTGHFYYSKEALTNMGLDTNRIVVLRLDNYRPSNADADNFVCETRLKDADHWPIIRCYTIQINIAGDSGLVSFRFVRPGCSHWAKYRIAEQHFDNKTDDLSFLSVDLRNFQTIRIQNQAQTISLWLGDQQLLKQSYHKSLGHLQGLSIIFHGNGSIDYCRLSSSDSLLFDHEF